MLPAKAVLWLTLAWRAASRPAEPAVPNVAASLASLSTRLNGRFLHITDIHPDPHYVFNSSIDEACHWPSQRGNGPHAGYWGTPVSDCDSPIALVNATFDWLAKKWAGQVDFIIWTGDSARHDLDSRIPRSFIEIVQLNSNLVSRMQEAFGPRVPIIPSIGNNDLYPHNIMFSGPSAVINSLQTLWRDLVPESEFHTFAKGAYYAVEVVPGLIVASLNTIYFFGSNKVVDGCPAGKKSRNDPGVEQLDWLETQLDRWRREGKQVWLSGHVPPSPGLWYENCEVRYKEIAIAFQDVILGHLFGHVNVDYFFLASHGDDVKGSFHPTSSSKALEAGLKTHFRGLPKLSKLSLDDFAVFHVSPSVVPTYQPAVRLYTYNVTASSAYKPKQYSSSDDDGVYETRLQQTLQVPDDSVEIEKKRRKKKKKKKEKGWPRLPRHASPSSPSRTNRYLTPLGYSQWMLDLAAANRIGTEIWPEWQLEYTTYTQQDFEGFLGGQLAPEQPTPFPWLNDSTTVAGWAGEIGKMTPYGMPDLTISRWLDLAHSLGQSGRQWKGFRKRMYVGAVAAGE